jgi:hypothetical protein
MPVFAKLLELAAAELDLAASRLAERKEDALGGIEPEAEAAANAVIRRTLESPMQKLEAIVSAVNPGEAEAKLQDAKSEETKPEQKKNKNEENPAANPQMLAQLKALRNWQTALQDRTAAFANAHPPGSLLNADDRAELDRLRKTQAQIAELFEELRKSLTEGAMP